MAHVQFLLTIVLASQLQTASLTITAPPGSEVFWEGVRLGTVSPKGVLRIGEIPPGDYRIAVRKPGYLPQERNVSLTAADLALAFHLRSSPAPPEEPKAKTRHGPVQPPVNQTSAAPLRAAETAAAPREPPSPSAGEPMPPSLSVGAEALEEKSSQIQDTLETPLFWSILVVCALLAALFRFLWSQRRTSREPQPVWRGVEEPFLVGGDPEPGPWPTPPAFLDDLRRQEEMAEQGMSDLVREAREKLIDLGRDDVRSVDD